MAGMCTRVAILLSVVSAAVAAPVATILEAYPTPKWYLGSSTTEAIANVAAILWPKDVTAHLAAWPNVTTTGRPATCWSNTLIDANATYADPCAGQIEVKDLTTAAACAAACKAEPLCPAYLFEVTNAAAGTGVCKVQSIKEGDMKGCGDFKYDDKKKGYGNTALYSSGRFMLGEVTVLKNLTEALDIKILGLSEVGKFKTGIAEAKNGPPELTFEESIAKCRAICYSTLTCQYWQYYKVEGCFIDLGQIVPPKGKTDLAEASPGYKPKSGIVKDSFGEYIQHVCKPPPTPASGVNATMPPTAAAPEATTPSPPTNLTPLWVTLGVLGAAALAGGAAYFVLGQGAEEVVTELLDDEGAEGLD